jgi:hypothetical protein
MDVVGLLVTLLVIGLILWLVLWAIDQIPGFAPFRGVARAIVAIIAVIMLLSLLTGTFSIPVFRAR